ncbi:MAG: response regulator [Symploca sp. SIO2G7]|nr:response regulator [Symploca sp. SIO2G7]
MNKHLASADKPNILIVDDTQENLRLLSTMLTESGYKVRKAINGNIALRAIKIEKPDLILLDIKMPDLDGYEVCKRLKLQKQTADIPVIFISALDEVVDKVKAFEAGGVDYITKPYQLQEVLARVRSQITISQQQRQLTKQQQKLLETNAKLQLIITTTKAISQAKDFDTALEITLYQVCEKIGWDFGEIWLPNSLATVFKAAAGWYASDGLQMGSKTKALSLRLTRYLLLVTCYSEILHQVENWLVKGGNSSSGNSDKI